MKLQSNAAYYIVQDCRLPSGGTLLGQRISRSMSRINVAKRVLKRVRRINPAAYVVQAGPL